MQRTSQRRGRARICVRGDLIVGYVEADVVVHREREDLGHQCKEGGLVRCGEARGWNTLCPGSGRAQVTGDMLAVEQVALLHEVESKSLRIIQCHAVGVGGDCAWEECADLFLGRQVEDAGLGSPR